MIYLVIALQALIILTILFCLLNLKKTFGYLNIKNNFKKLNRIDDLEKYTESIKNLIEFIIKKMDTERIEENKQIEEWIKLAENEIKNDNKVNAIEIIETALNHYPYSKNLIEKFSSLLVPLAENGDGIIRRDAITRMNVKLSNYKNSCSIENYKFSQESQNNLNKLNTKLINESFNKQKQDIITKLNQLEKRASSLLKKEKLTEEEMNELANLDDNIDKDVIKANNELQKKYDKLSKKVIEYFKNTDKMSEKSENKNYNIKAINSVKKAYKKFNDNKSEYKKGNKLTELVDLLGGWDNRYLLQSTLTYTSSVYAEIFQKLKPEARLKMTELMVKVNMKKNYE